MEDKIKQFTEEIEEFLIEGKEHLENYKENQNRGMKLEVIHK